MAGLLGNFKNPFASGGLLSDPNVRLAMGAEMLRGGTLGEQLGNGLNAGAWFSEQNKTKREALEKTNKTVEWLKSINPELAQAVEMGALGAGDAYKMAVEKPKHPDFMEIDGYAFNPETGQFLSPPGGGNKPTTEQQNLEWRAAQAGLGRGTPEYRRFMLSGGGGGVTVNNEGNPPVGYMANRDAEGRLISYSPIPGSPAALEASAAQNKQSLARSGKETSATVVTDDIDRAFKTMDNATLPTTGWFGEKLSDVGGTAARDVAGLAKTIKANASFDKLQQMRESSPTGAALGAVSDTEMGLLGAAIGDLDQSQSDGQFRDNLARIQNIYLDIIHGPNAGPPRRKLSYKGNQIPGITTQPPAPMPQAGAPIGSAQKRLRYNQATGELE